MSARHPGYKQFVRPAGWDLRSIREQVVADDETLLLEYFLGAERSYVWAVTRAGLSSYELPHPAQIGRAAERVYELLSVRPGKDGGEVATEAVLELSRMVLSPAAEELRGRRRVVVV